MTVLFVVFAGVLVGPATPACACSCAQRSPAEYAQSADLVVDGVVTDVDAPVLPIMSSTDDITVTVRVQSVHKGQAGGEIALRTAREGPSCGADLRVGRRYTLFLEDRDGVWRTSLCSGNRELPAGAPPTPPGSGVPGDGPGWVPVANERPWGQAAALAGSAAAVVAGMLFLAHRRWVV